MLCACAEPQSFQTDPFCPDCIEKACANTVTDTDFQAHFNALSNEDKAQMTALVEAIDGCFDRQPWIVEIADKSYQSFPNALYAPSRPMHKAVVLRALDEILQNTPNRAAALNYLIKHASLWKDKTWASDNITALKEHTEEDDLFPLLVQIADPGFLEELAALGPSPIRDNALIYRWQELSEETKLRALGAWVSAEWSMQTSGSAQLPQYLALDWKKRPFPDGVPNFVASIHVDSIKIQNNEVKRRDWFAKDVFQCPPLREPNALHARVDLSPWLNTADNYRITASAVLEIWPPDAPQNCLNHEEGCDSSPIIATPIEFNRSYRVFVGVETGAPHREKNDKANAPTNSAFSMQICSGETCIPLWENGAKTKERSTKLDIRQGSNFYVTASAATADLPVASRLMARSGNTDSWREIATFFSYAPMAYDIPMRSEVNLGNLCSKLGPCKLELQLRPSLRMARHDPRITKYWGSTLELGFITLEMLDQTPQQITH